MPSYSSFYDLLEPKIPFGTAGQYWRGDKTWKTLDKAAVGLSNVENTALSTWAGSANVTTLGTVASGTWNATAIGVTKGGTGLTGITASRLLWSTGTNTLGEIALGYGMQVASGELRTPQDLRTSASPVFTKIISGSNTFGPSVPTTTAMTSLGVLQVVKNERVFYCGVVDSFGPTPYCELSSFKYDDSTTLPLVFNANGGSVFIGFPSSLTGASKLSVVGDISTLSGADGGGLHYNYSADASSRSWKLRTDVNAYGEFVISTSTTQTGSTFTDRLTIDLAGLLTLSGALKTAAPSGGTAKPWKLGNRASVSPTSPNRTIEVEVDGVTLYIHAKTTND